MSKNISTMSARSNPLPINKAPSSENVCKFKEDRVRNNGNSYKHKHRSDNGNSTKSVGNYSNQTSNRKSQINTNQKQPRARSVWGGKRTKVTGELREEMGGKKVNLNHLLNFTFEHEEAFYSSGKVGPRTRHAVKESFYNKEQFIQANCQFVMKESGKSSSQFSDIDLPVEWDDVEKVNIWREEIPTCPICLGEFCAAHMTKCGHIYCWPCILHYLALDDKSWRKCPICHEAVHKKDLKSVTVHKEKSVKVQTLIAMRLMKRRRDSNVAVPADQEFVDDSHFLHSATAAEKRNLKYLVASDEEVLEDIVNVEKAQLEFKYATELEEFEQTFIKSALDLCEQRAASLLENINAAKTVETVVEKQIVDSNAEALPHSGKKEICPKPCDSNKLKCNDKELANTDDTVGGNGAEDDGARKKVNEHIVYFYQASDGQHVYLHPLNARCLLEQNGNYARCPPKINAKILEREEFSMNEELRKRHRHLAHLPLSLEFRIVELDLRPPLVSAVVLASFQEALDRRAAFRRKKARDEKRILRKSQNIAMRKQGKYSAARICLENHRQFPQIQQFDPQSSSYSVLLPSPGSTPQSDSVLPLASAQEAPDGSVASSSSESSLSFAQLLKSSGSEEHVTWSRRAPVPAHTSSDIGEKADTDDDDDDNFAAPPAYQHSFGDAICVALDNMTPISGGKSKRGRKSKKMVLFSNSGQHH